MRRTLSLVAGVMVATAAWSQVGSNCPARTALQLPLILDEIKNHIPDDHIVDLIDGCHVAFALDPASLDRIVSAGASQTILAALDRDTISRMTLAQARSEVAALENRKQLNETASNPKRDTELQRSDAVFQAEYKKPKTEFETTDQYKTRLAAMQKEHDIARAAINARYAADLNRQDGPLDRRIRAIKSGLFPVVGAPPVYGSYDADASRLTVTIGGEEFLFSVVPDRARTLKAEWALVKVTQRYSDQDLPDRFLNGPTLAEPILGRSKSGIQLDQLNRQIVAALGQARKLLNARSYEKARDEYTRILSLDPDDRLKHNQAAMDGIAEANKLVEEAVGRKATAEQFRQNLIQNPHSISGAWFDSGTNLLWTDKDNGSDGSWAQAKDYCAAQIIGGLPGWRLATVAELRGIYSESSTKYAIVGRNKNAYHIKGDIVMTETIAWSSEAGKDGLAFIFSFGNNQQYLISHDAPHPRTLCTRPLDESIALSNTLSEVTPAVTPTSSENIVDRAATLAIQAELPRPLLRVHYWLLKNDPRTALASGGIRVPSGESAERKMTAICGQNPVECKKVTLALDTASAAKLYGDATGNGTFPGVPPGAYFLVASAVYADALHIWTQRVDLKVGPSSKVIRGK